MTEARRKKIEALIKDRKKKELCCCLLCIRYYEKNKKEERIKLLDKPLDQNFWGEGEIEYIQRLQSFLAKEIKKVDKNGQVFYKNIPVWRGTWFLKFIFLFIPTQKAVATDGTVYFKKFRGIIYITKFI